MAEETNKQQSNININYNAAQTGLDMDRTLGQIAKGKLTYALNANVENFDSNSVNYQNEEGNELCLEFPTGYQVVGKHYIQEKAKHIFLLSNPTTGDSEIGYMVNNDCVYHSLLNDVCLGFDVDYPVQKIVHRITNCSTEIYWAQANKPRRFLNIEDVPTEDVCNKLSLQPNFSIPQLDIAEVVTGGELLAGTYQFAIQYCDAQGFGYTSYYSVTNPTPIANPDVTTPESNYPVNKSIRVAISNLETNGYFEYYNLAVIKTINSITSVELIGTYFIDAVANDITYTGQNQTQIRLSIQDIFEKFPYYDIAGDVTSVQDVLVWDQLSSNERVNYQSIAAQIELKWQTYKVPAGTNYSDPNVATKLRGYLRDEVYAFEICFLLKNGQQTDGFHIPGREFIQAIDGESIPDTNPDYIGTGTSSPKWKIYNTAYDVTPATGDSIAGATPHEYGEFAYWESEDVYPSDINVWGDPNDPSTPWGLAGKQIRHHKFPDVLVSPIFESAALVGGLPVMKTSDAVYPIGVRVDIDQVKSIIANSTLTQEQKDNIVGFKILRGNRSTNKSIVGKGIIRNVGKYTREGTTYMFPNYPYNDLREDPFLLSENNMYVNSCYSWVYYPTSWSGSIQYTSCNNGETLSVSYTNTSISFSICSATKPIITVSSSGTITGPLRGSIYFNTSYTILVNGVGATEFIYYQVGQVSPTTIIVSPNTPTTIIGSVGPSYVSGNTDFTITTAPASCLQQNSLQAFSDANFSKERMVFNSPETSFGQPSLGSIVKLENCLYGAGKAHFVKVAKNAEYKLITDIAQKNALDSSYDIAISTGTFDATAMFTTYQAYLQIYINGITRENFAYSFNSVASYDYYTNVANSGNKQRELDKYQYIIPGVQSVSDTYDINNFQRESSVYLKTSGSSRLPYAETVSSITDNSRFTISEKSNCQQPEKEERFTSSVYYASLKNIIVNQYGQLYSYETIDTGFQIDLDTTSSIGVVFGGDTFISKFAFKTKLPFFIDNRVGAPNDSDINYDELGNVAYPRYWHSSKSILSDYVTKNNTTLQNIISIKAHNFDCDTLSVPIDTSTSTTTTSTTSTSNNSEISPSFVNSSYKGKFYMFTYGIPYFYCESSINTDLRQATNNRDGDFYPHVSSGIPDSWVQQTNVPIALDNTYNYNITFSKQNTENYFSHLPIDWDGSQCRTEFPFRAIYSDPQVSAPDSKVNNWLIYRPVSYFDFPQSYGDLVSLDGIQNKAILARFENKSLLYNTLLTINTSNPQAAYVGNSQLFRSAPPIDFAETDLGYVGSQHKFLLKIPQGQISVDAKRGQIFLLSGNGATDLTGFGSGVNRFMTDHLAFEILRYFPEINVDNSYKGLGIAGVYDSKYDRVLITKLDYIPQPDYVNQITYNTVDKEFYVGETKISLTDSTYFCNKSWTLSFNMNTKSWVSFHTYLPNYYIGDNNFYYSGTSTGMWVHLTNTLLNNTYYGTIAPYVIEYPFAYEYHDEILQNVKDFTRVFQYLPIPDGVFNDNAKIQTDDYYFNKAILYNGQQSTGLLKLVKKPMNNLAAYNQYPQYNADSKTILYTKSDSFYQYNTFWNIVKDKTQPLFDTTCESLSIDRVINQDNMDYGTRSFRKDPLRAKGLLIRHILDDRSDIHLVSQFIVAPSQISFK